MDSKNKKTAFKRVRQGLAIFKTGQSQYYFARIWLPKKKKYVVKSTKETSRVDASEVAEEIYLKLKNEGETFIYSPESKFNHFSKILMKQQKAMSGKTRSERFHKDDEKLILREIDGIDAHFGNWEINDITTFDLREYLSHLDDNRDKPLSASSKSKHLTVIGKILKVAYEMGKLDKMPFIPKVTSEDNPRPSFSESEYKKFLKTTRDLIQADTFVRGIKLTDEVYYLFVFLVHSFLRPVESEVYAIKHQDVQVQSKPDRLEIRVQGKTGFRVVSTMPDAVDFYKKLCELKPDHKEDDYIFFNDYPNRSTALRNINRQFATILDVADLRETRDGQLRTPYALRHYALQTRLIKSKGKVNIFNLAKNAGTSVEQLERFYLKNLEMSDELIENLQTF